MVKAVCTSNEAKRRFEILSRVVFSRSKALLVETCALTYAEQHDNIEAIYKNRTSFILDQVYLSLPEPPYTADDKAEVAQLIYRHIWQQSTRGSLLS